MENREIQSKYGVKKRDFIPVIGIPIYLDRTKSHFSDGVNATEKMFKNLDSLAIYHLAASTALTVGIFTD